MSDGLQLSWCENPRKGKKQFVWKMVRTPKRGALDFTVLSPRSLGLFTHWFDGRTFPHRLADCSACKHNIRMEYHAYVAAFKTNGLERIVVEFTERVDGFVLDWLRERRSLRGAVMSMKRMGESACSKIHLKIARDCTDVPDSMPSPDLRGILAHIWKLPDLDGKEIEEHPPRIMEDGPEESSAAATLRSFENRMVS